MKRLVIVAALVLMGCQPTNVSDEYPDINPERMERVARYTNRTESWEILRDTKTGAEYLIVVRLGSIAITQMAGKGK